MTEPDYHDCEYKVRLAEAEAREARAACTRCGCSMGVVGDVDWAHENAVLRYRLAEADDARASELAYVIEAVREALRERDEWKDELRDLLAWANSRATVKFAADSARENDRA